MGSARRLSRSTPTQKKREGRGFKGFFGKLLNSDDRRALSIPDIFVLDRASHYVLVVVECFASDHDEKAQDA
jgi:hypothetical protein